MEQEEDGRGIETTVDKTESEDEDGNDKDDVSEEKEEKVAAVPSKLRAVTRGRACEVREAERLFVSRLRTGQHPETGVFFNALSCYPVS